jgi:hypothetical protein
MNVEAIHSLAIDAIGKEITLVHEQQDYLLLLKGYRHYTVTEESQVLQLLEQLKRDCRLGKYSLRLLMRLKISLEARLRALRRKS